MGDVKTRSTQTLTIERLLKEDTHSLTSIASAAGVSRQRVHQIKKRMLARYVSIGVVNLTAGDCQEGFKQDFKEPVVSDSMKALTIRFTPAVFDALTEACAVSNRQSLDETITIEDYVEECAINRVVELGLLRRRAK